MTDPYTHQNGALKNRLDLNNQKDLDAFESNFVGIRALYLDKISIKPPFSFKTLRFIHGYLFQDIYEWAGKPRTTFLAKREFENSDGRVSEFTPPYLIEQEAQAIFDSFPAPSKLKQMSKVAFISEIASFFVAINSLHPFREGNGRSQRHLLKVIAASAGYALEWGVVNRERNVMISIAGHQGDLDPARRLFAEITDKDRVRALEKAMNFLKLSKKVAWNDLYVSTTTAGRIYNGILVGRGGSDFIMKVQEKPQDWIAVGDVVDLPEEAQSNDPISVKATRWKGPKI